MSEDFSTKLQRIEEKLDSIMKILEERLSPMKDVNVLPMKVDSRLSGQINVYLLKLPDSLRQTMIAIGRVKEATTSDIAKVTGRSRSVESIHLNQLERMGYIEKYRIGRKIFFRSPSPSK